MAFDTASLQNLLLLTLVTALVWAAVSDVLSRRISNRVCGLIALTGTAYLSLGSGAVVFHLLTGAIVLVLGFAAFARGWVGGGDAKLLAACSLWFGPGAVLGFLCFTAAAGGGLALVWMLERPARYALARGGFDIGLNATGELPYGVAIAAGALGAAVVTGIL